MNAILSADLNFGIGANNDLLIKIPDDLKRFKAITKNKTVIMGHSTLLSLPNQKPLSHRKNIVFSRQNGLEIEGAVVVNSIEALFEHDVKNAFVIGGAEIYKLLLDYCEKIYVTKIFKSFSADKFIIDLDNTGNFKIKEKSEIFNFNGIEYQYILYEKQRIS